MYNDPACKPWTSRKWAPPGYTSRYDHEYTHEKDGDTVGLNGATASGNTTPPINEKTGVANGKLGGVEDGRVSNTGVDGGMKADGTAGDVSHAERI